MYLPLISFLTELWQSFDVSAVAGHDGVFAALLLQFWHSLSFSLTFFVAKC